MKLLIATHNVGKKREFAELLAGLKLQLYTLDELGITTSIPETSESYIANALGKAQGYANLAQLLTLADDSGLEVDALHGEPGVYSARFGGAISDAQRCEMLLQRLQGVPYEKRAARFRCVIALCWPDNRQQWVEGLCEGHIATEMRGKNGFGYDPIFWVDEAGMTMAELPAAAKNRISHRAKAAQKARAVLVPLIARECK
ncbi:MAG: RdgB/HAM1 family non-canonical purine NTP pyrophosphatase [Chloroflexi bacterium]|nr:RdgB/HAM1 family non-canonical purine NTP pyrophosphatase [Chloroflexota bacterium]